MILEISEACSTYFYHGVIYDIMMYYRYESYMGVLMVELTVGYRQYIGIIILF